MRTHRVLFAVTLAVLVGIFAGCSDDKGVNSGQTLDQQAIANVINTSSAFEHDVVAHDVPDTTAVVAGVESYFWWREYTAVNRQLTIDVQPADSTHTDPYASVSVATTFTGALHIVHYSAADVYTHSTKLLVDVFTQNASFEQQLSVDSPNRGWVQTEMSNIVGGSVPTTMTINTLNIDAAQGDDRLYTDQTIADPYVTADQMVLGLDENVNIWVQSGAGTNRVFRHDWSDGSATREELTNLELGFYSQQMTTPTTLTLAQAQRHMVIDVIAPDVITGPAAYDARVWAVPYAVNLNP